MKRIVALGAMTLVALSIAYATVPRHPSAHAALGRTRPTSRSEMRTELRKLLADSALAPCFIGVEIRSLRDKSVLFEQNSRKLFHPGSNMKLLTTATALHRLDPSFRFTTAAGARSAIRDSVLEGDLIVAGTGDPLLMPADLDSLAQMIAARGIRRITGGIIGDVSRFDSVGWGKGWMWDDEPYSDFPFLTPLCVHHNVISLRVTPSSAPGGAPGFTMEPASAEVKVLSAAITGTDTLIAPLDGDRIRNTNTFRLFGRIAPDDTAKHLDLTIWKPAEWLLALLRDRLLGRGVRIVGGLSTSLTPVPFADTLGEVTHGLDTVVERTNKESYNLGAEMLLKTLGAEGSSPPGSAEAGLAAVKSYLAEADADTTAMILADGSGVSWYTVVSPSAVCRLLQHEFDQSATFGRFRRSLPVAGIDGSLKNRMKGTKAEGNAAAKTGTLTGVSCLSGYVTTAGGAPVAFSILCNHFPGELSVLRALQNSIVALVAGTDLRKR